MQRSGPLKRKTPLKSGRYTPPIKGNPVKHLDRGKALKPLSDKRRLEQGQRNRVWNEVAQRDGHRCQLAGVDGAGRCFGGPSMHHKRKAAQGGTYTPDNLVLLCVGHNDRIESDADLAKLCERLGFVIRPPKFPMFGEGLVTD